MEVAELRAQYDIKRSSYLSLCTEMKKQIEFLLDEQGIQLAFPVEYRIKQWDSILGKIEKYKMEIDDICAINDIAGLRIVTLFKHDISKVCKIIDGLFESRRKEDTSKRLGDNEFGYGSIHFEVTVPASWVSLPTNRSHEGLYAEIQVRTVSQHIWAASSHVLQYKNKEDVPLPLRRAINRVAALLETVDLEFQRVIEERDVYQEIQAAIDDDINVETLKNLLDDKFPAINKFKQENYSMLVDVLIELEITSISRLREIIESHYEEVMAEDREMAMQVMKEVEQGKRKNPDFDEEGDRYRNCVYYSHVGLLNRSLIRIFDEEMVFRTIRKYLKRN